MKHVTEVIVDDLDGSPGALTRNFMFQSVNYTIDLNEDNFQRLALLLRFYAERGELIRVDKKYNNLIKTTHPKKNSSQSTESTKTANAIMRERQAELKLIRDWAKAKKIDIPSRGRIPGLIVSIYETAQKRNLNGTV